MGRVVGHTDVGRGVSRPLHRWVGALAALLAVCSAVTTGCVSDSIVTSDDAPPSTQAGGPTTPPTSARLTNDGLVNAFDFVAQPEGRTGYYFTSPSKRWVCAIIPEEGAGCQSSDDSRIAITGAPDSVLNAQGNASSPNAIQVGDTSDARFASVDSPGYSLIPGPAAILPFGKLLTVAGFSCNVQEVAGISCLSERTGKGFTFTADGYTLRYTDLPG